MSGVLLQLGAFSDKDAILCGNPEISYFKSIYKRYTYFAMCDNINNNENTPKPDSLIKIIINKAGDLLSNINLNIGVELNGTEGHEYSLIDNFAYNIIEYVELKIGKYTIDRLTSDWFYIYNELNNKDKFNDKLINAPSCYLSNFVADGNTKSFNIYLPLLFYFCRYDNTPLPISALRTHERLELIIKFRPENMLFNKSYKVMESKNVNDSLISYSYCNAIATNIYLHPDERKSIIQKQHNILIEQLYNISTPLKCIKNKKNVVSEKVEINFNSLSKSIFWIIKQDKFINNLNNENYIIYKNNEINITQFKHLILNLILGVIGTSASYKNLGIDDNYFLTINDIATVIKFNKNFSFGNVTFSQIKNDIRNIFNNIKIYERNPKDNLTINDISVPGYYSEREKQILGHMFNKYLSELNDNGSESNNLFEFVTFYSIDTSPLSNKHLRLFINVEHNIYTQTYNSNINPINYSHIKFEANPRTPTELEGKYYNSIIPHRHKLLTPNNGIYMYSFALNPFSSKPSGHNNFDNLLTASLNLELNENINNASLEFFSLEYNIFNIKNNNFCLTFN